MRKIKFGFIFVVSFIILSLSCVSVHAAEIKAILENEKTELNSGEEAVITLSFDNYEEINKGINAYKATLEYDENVFEEVSQSDFKTHNNWEELKFNKDTGEFVAIKKAGSKTSEEIVTLTLKVKENANAGKEDILIKDIVASEGKEDIIVGEVKTTVDIIQDQSNKPGDSGDQDSSNKPGDSGDQSSSNKPGSSGNQSSSNNEGDSTNSDNLIAGNLPQTGDTTNWKFWFGLILVEVGIAIIYIKKDKEKILIYKNKKVIMLLIIGMISLQTVGTVAVAASSFSSKGELNADGYIDYQDVHLLQLYLINQGKLEGNAIKNADMNSDGSITVTDLTLLIQKLEKTLDYEVILDDMEQYNYYPRKNEEVNLNFLGHVSYDGVIEKVIINNNEYQVKKVEDSSIYTVNVGKNDTSGIKEYYFTEVLLNNGKRVDVDYKIKVDVLKDAPSIESYTVNEDINESKVDISFYLKDDDNSIKSANIKVLSESQEVIVNSEISAGDNKIEAQLEDGKKYTVKFDIYYDLDTNELIEHEEDHTGTIEETKELQFVVDYQWNISDIATYKNGAQTAMFDKNEAIQIRFNSSNATRFEPAFVRVNGKEYPVTKENQQYITTIDGIDQAGKTEINLEEVVLSNGKRFSVNEGNIIPVTILKSKPIVSDMDIKEDVKNDTLTARFNLTDEDKALKLSNIVLLDENNNEIDKKEVKAEENEIELNTKLSKKYIVKIIATYSLSDGEEITDAILMEQEIEAQPRAEVKSVTSDKAYVEKGDNITLKFVIDTNKTEEIKKIRVNNLECIATKLSDGNYQVTYPVSKESGVQEINTTKLTYSDGKTADVSNKIKIEVLKDKPSIKEFVQKDNLNESRVILDFNVADEDKTFISGKAVLKNKDDNSVEEQNVAEGKNSLSFSVKEGKQYILDIYATYDRDTNSLEGHEADENKVTDEKLHTESIELVADYQLKISNVKSYKKDIETKYFDKKEEIDIRFESTNATIFKPEKAVINGSEYSLVEENGVYKATISGFDNAGKEEITIEKVILSNTKELPVIDNNSVDIEVLKDKPTATEFKYKEDGNTQIEATFNIVDPENTIESGEVLVYDKDRNEIKKQDIKSGVNTITFDKNSSSTYSVEVIASYDLDSDQLENGKNEYNNQTLLKEEVVVENIDRLLEVKDVLDVTIYEKEMNGTGKGEFREINEFYYKYIDYYPDYYIAKIKMKDMPEFYATINDYRIENGKCYLILDYDDNIIQYIGNGQQQNKFEVLYGDVKGGFAYSDTASNLISRIKANPSGTFVLTKDYDFSDYGSGEPLVGNGFEFKGKIDGNGHTIRNLSGPLFDLLKEATVENLIIENVYIGSRSSGSGALAKRAVRNTSITNVHVKNFTKHTSANDTIGGIVGSAVESTIKDSSVRNLKITKGASDNYSARDTLGGIAGAINNVNIENCYVEGSIDGKSSIGGIVGAVEQWQRDNRSTIKNSISKVDIRATEGGSGGILGNGLKAITLENNISLSTGSNAKRLYGTGDVTLNGRNVVMSESTLDENTERNIKTISKDDFSEKTLKELKFSESIWNFNNSSYDYLPVLKNDDPRNTLEAEFIDTSMYIPNYEILKQREDYDSNKKIAYSNLYKLMPFYDSKYLIIDGKKISDDHVLNQKFIDSVFAFDANKEVMTYITEENYYKINSIKILFEDGTTEDYKVSYKYKDTSNPTKTYGRVAMYKIDDLGVEYNYNGYIIKQDAGIVNEIINYLKSLEYDKDLKGLEDFHSWDKRGYAVLKAYFNDVFRSEKNLKEFVMNLVANVDGYSVTLENEGVENIIRRNVINNEYFKRVLLAYTYYSRFYGVEIGGTTVSDMMLFRGSLYRKNIEFRNLIDQFWQAKYKSTHVLYAGYRDSLGPALGIYTQGELIEKTVNALTDYKDPNAWFVDYFKAKNLLTESAAKDYETTADYRAWTQIKKQPKYIMNILTLPKDSAFLVSAPGTFLVGSQMVYLEDPTNKEQQDKLLADMKKFGDQMANFYNNVLGIIDVSYLNNYADAQIDSTNVRVYGPQSNGNSTDPFHINFNEPLNEWFMAAGASAYATDGVINYASAALSGYDWMWTHEIGHNQSYKLFFKGNGFRPIGGGNSYNVGREDYTDGHTKQGFGDGDVNWNLSYDYTPDSLITTNLTQDRINSLEKLDSYYKGMYEAIDFLDYVEAKAFLKLTPEEQAKVAVQIQYRNPNDHSTVTWKQISAEEFKAMNLQTVEDLWDNRIAIRPGVTGEWSQSGDGAYGSEGMYIRRWYQPYNDNGRTHTYGFTYTTWQMLGISGYENGYLNWFTGKSRTDLDAIKKITKDDTMTWEKFKKERYKLMEDSLDTIPYIDSESLVEDYVNALKADASNNDRNVSASTNIRRINYHYLKRMTDDFRKEVLTGKNDAIHISTAEEFKEKITQNQVGDASGNTKYYIGNYILDNDIDLSKIAVDGDTIIDGYFMGNLDGNGHKLIGNKAPIFNNIKFANISNLTVEDSEIQITDASNEKTGSLAKVVEYSEIDNVIARNITVNAKKEVGALVGYMKGALVKNTHVTDVIVSGTDRVGAIAGYIDSSQILESSAKGEISASGNAVGGFIGEIVNESVIKDCYSIGKAKGNNDVGGFIGYVDKSSIINSFSNARADGNNGVASFVGQTVNNSMIENNITLVNQFKGYKFDGRTANDKFTNFSGNYENEGNAGTSTRNRTGIDFDGKIDIAPENDVKTEGFYTKTLGWNEEIWDFSKVSGGGIPKLKNSDPNDNSSAVEKYTVKSADEFIDKINADPYGVFIIDNDIDFSSKDRIIDVEFRGIIEGNGHKLSGNKTPIFNNLNKAKITGLILEGSKITTEQDNVGALAKTSINSEIENIHVTEATITGANSKVGGIVGYAENSTLKLSSSNASILATGNDVGGLVGEIKNSTIIENSYSSGAAQGNQNVGGLVGNVVESTIKYSHSVTSVNGMNGVAGFIGQSTDNSNIQNNIVLGNQSNQYKFDAKTEASQFVNYSNNYEYEENRGKSTLSRQGIDFTGKINVAKKDQITSKDFYTNTLGWDENIWDLSSVTNEHTPKLKKLDPNKTKAIGVYKAEINSVDEFITELTANPSGEFTIKTDLDFSGKDYNVGTVLIPGTFDGVIKGEGHTIKNLKNATIFEQFNGEVDSLNIDKFDYGAVYFTGIYEQFVSPGQSDKTQSNIAVFAKKSLSAAYSNMKLTRITMFGYDNVAVVVAVDYNSTFENINVSQAYLNVGEYNKGGNNTSTFIGKKTGGSIKNCYVHGEMTTDGKDSGGIIGIAQGDVKIENVISNIYAKNGVKGNVETNGVFIGKMDATTVIKNSAALGTAAKNNPGIRKFAGTIEDINSIENCYENSSANGTSNANGNNINAVDKVQLKDKNFYVNTLGFDEAIWSLDNIEERYYTESVSAHGQGRPEDFPLMIFFGLK